MRLSSLLLASAWSLLCRVTVTAAASYSPVGTLGELEVYQPLACITQPSALQGCFATTTFAAAGPMFRVPPNDERRRRQDQGQDPYALEMRVLLPHSEDDPYGCQPMTHARTDEGVSLAGAMVLVVRGNGCDFSQKVAHAEAVHLQPEMQGGSLGAVAIVGCAGTACNPGLASPGATNAFNTTGIYIATHDGQLLRQYLADQRALWQANHSYVAPPLIVSVVATGPDPTHPDDVAVLRQLADTMTFAFPPGSEANFLVPWVAMRTAPHHQQQQQSEVDPCLQRLLGVWCERGRVVALSLYALGITGSLPTLALPALKVVRMSNNALAGALPADMCNLAALQTVELQTNGFTSLPACFGVGNTNLTRLSLAGNALTTFPFGLADSSTLQTLNLALNQIVVPPQREAELTSVLLSLAALQLLQLNNNPLMRFDASQLRFGAGGAGGMVGLQQVLLGQTGMYGSLPSDVFDFASPSPLAYVDLHSTGLGLSPLPTFRGCVQLHTIDLGQAGFVGPVPTEWTEIANGTTTTSGGSGDVNHTNSLTPPVVNLASLQWLSLAGNGLNSTYLPLGQLPALTYLDVSSNALTNYPGLDVGESLSFLISNTLSELHANWNQFQGPWNAGWFTSSSLTLLHVRGNAITNLPSQLFEYLVTSADFSSNRLSGPLPLGAPQTVNLPASASGAWSLLDLQGNPNLTAWPLPDWMAIAHPPVYQLTAEQRYACLSVAAANTTSMRVLVDPEFSQFRLCQCTPSYYGYPPLCVAAPILTVSSPYLLPQGDDPTVDFARAIQTAEFVNQTLPNETPGGMRPLPPGAIEQLGNVTVPPVQFPFALTDQWFGDARYTSGLTSQFQIDLSYLFLPASIVAGAGAATNVTTAQRVVVPSQNVTAAEIGSAQLVPVRAITVRLHLAVATFSASTSLTVSSVLGPDQLQQVLFLDQAIVGALPRVTSGLANTSEYMVAYNDTLSQLVPPVAYVELVVPSSVVSLAFTSRDPGGAHFVATYAEAFVCPDQMEVCADQACQAYATCVPVPHVASGISVLAVVIASACVVVLVLGLLGWERYHRQRIEREQASAASAGEDLDASNRSMSAVRVRLVEALRQQRGTQLLVDTAVVVGGVLWDCASCATNIVVIVGVFNASSSSSSELRRLLFFVVGTLSTLGFVLNLASRSAILHRLAAEWYAKRWTHDERETRQRRTSPGVAVGGGSSDDASVQGESLEFAQHSLEESLLDEPATDDAAADQDDVCGEVGADEGASSVVTVVGVVGASSSSPSSVASLSSRLLHARVGSRAADRRLLCLRVVLLAVLLESLPWLTLNTWDFTANLATRSFAGEVSLVLAAISCGLKLQQLAGLTKAKADVTRMRLRVVATQMQIDQQLRQDQQQEQAQSKRWTTLGLQATSSRRDHLPEAKEAEA